MTPGALTRDVNPVKRALEAGGVSLGSFLVSADAMVAEVMAHGLADWLVVDMEASHATKRDIVHILQALNAYRVEAIVRVPDHGRHMIEACLDFGAAGILAPKVDDEAEARAIADACRYPPDGTRSVNCIRASSYYTNAGPYIRGANRRVLCLVQIESAAGVSNSGAIASVPGVEGLFVGPGDLAASYGQIGVVSGARMAAARQAVAAACTAHGKIPGIFAHDAASARLYASEGFRMIAVGNDVKFLADGMASALRAAAAP
jgi:2-keto-3-deoxy-L-rhamnonate aldolase RhmA